MQFILTDTLLSFFITFSRYQNRLYPFEVIVHGLTDVSCHVLLDLTAIEVRYPIDANFANLKFRLKCVREN